MATKTVVVCDECGELGRTVRVKVNGKSLERDLCKDHEHDAFLGWRRARKGRPTGS